MMEVLSIHHGSVAARFPKTWRYRTLIAVHRAQNSVIMHRKGYGPDWKEEIRGELLRYLELGRLPLQALQLAGDWLREAERKNWISSRTKRFAAKSVKIKLIAAE